MVDSTVADLGSSVNVVIVAFHNSASEVSELFNIISQAGQDAGMVMSTTLVVNDENSYVCSPDTTVISGHGNIGFSAGIALGVRSVESDYVLIMNPDCVITKQNIERLFTRLNSNCGILVPILEMSPGKVDINIYQSWVFTPARQISKLACKKFLLRSTSEAFPRFVKAPGTFLLMKTSVALLLDAPFDDSFYLYGEDRDMTFRARAMGIPMTLVRDVVIGHPGGASARKVSSLVARSQADGMLRVAYRRYGPLGLHLMKLNILVEAAVKDFLRGTKLMRSRRWAIRRWRHRGPAPALRQLDFKDLAAIAEIRDETKDS